MQTLSLSLLCGRRCYLFIIYLNWRQVYDANLSNFWSVFLSSIIVCSYLIFQVTILLPTQHVLLEVS